MTQRLDDGATHNSDKDEFYTGAGAEAETLFVTDAEALDFSGATSIAQGRSLAATVTVQAKTADGSPSEDYFLAFAMDRDPGTDLCLQPRSCIRIASSLVEGDFGAG